MEKILDLNQIKLDDKNPRYATIKNKSENMVDFMIKNTKSSWIVDMIKDMAENGSNPLDVIGVFEENGKYVALDGNRRVLALKILFGHYEGNIPKIISSAVDEVRLKADSRKKELKEKIKVKLFKNRGEAKKWLLRKHTHDFGGASSQSWLTLERKIYKEDNLATLIAKQGNEAGIPYEDFAVNVKYTVWQRFFASNFSRQWMGVEYDKENKKFNITNEKQFQERMWAIVKGSREKIVNFNSVSKKKDKIKTINKLNENYLGKSKFIKEVKNDTKNKKIKIGKKKTKYYNDEKMPEILKEMILESNGIDYEKKTFLAAMTIRPILEFSVNYFLLKEQILDKNSINGQNNTLQKKTWQVIENVKLFDEDRFKPFWTSNQNWRETLRQINWTIHVIDEEWKINSRDVGNMIAGINLLMEAIWEKMN